MAWVEIAPSGVYQIAFRVGDRKLKRSLRTTIRKEAEAARSRLEENLRLLERGRLILPPHADIASFLLSDGRVEQPIAVPRPVTISELFRRYRQELPSGSLEANSLATIGTHLKHLERLLGKSVALTQVSTTTLQRYVDQRAKEKGRGGRTISPTTIRKEMTTFSSVWNWGITHDYVEGRFPNRRLKYPKSTDKPAFQSWDQIDRRIERGGLTDAQIKELWDSLYLNVEQIREALKHVQDIAQHEFIFPIILTAAHTGMRRSELMRAEIDDFDLKTKTIQVREKKRVRGRMTTRVVPMSELLCETLTAWFAEHPGGQSAFCLGPNVCRSRKAVDSARSLTVDEANHHFKQVFLNSKWSVLRGWHVFRHSFASNCAARGLDKRMDGASNRSDGETLPAPVLGCQFSRFIRHLQPVIAYPVIPYAQKSGGRDEPGRIVTAESARAAGSFTRVS